MKTFRDFLIENKIETIEPLDEESMTASTQTSGVAMPDSPKINKSKFMGHDVLEVDEETFHVCIKGKVPFKRWANYVKDDTLRDEMRSMYQKKNKLLMKNVKTGDMAFVK